MNNRVVPLFGMVVVTNRDDRVRRQSPLQQNLLGHAAVVGAPRFLLPLIERPLALTYYEARFPTRTVRWVRLVNPELRFWGGTWEIAELDVLTDAGEAEGGPP